MRAGVVVAVAVALLLPAPAAAQEVEGALLLVMDSSGSMARTDAAGRPLIDGAKDALRGLVGALPAGAPVGLRVYGHRVPNTDQANGCQDTELIVPVGPLDPAAMSAALDRFTPVGFTPIGLSLQQAAQDLPPEGPRTIVLVSDGEDTCASPDPCQVARDLAAQGIDLRVETVGFYLQGNAAAEQQLRCIADATGGSYRTADTAAQLADELRTLSIRALSQYGLQGEPVEGAPVPQQAPVLEPGTYSDTILANEARWYGIELEQGDVLTFDATQPGSSDPGGFIAVRLLDPALRSVGGVSFLDVHATADVVRFNDTPIGEGGYEPGTYYVGMEGSDNLSGEVPYDFAIGVEQVQASPSPSPSEEEPSPSSSPTPQQEPSPSPSPSPVAVPANDAGGFSTLAAFLVGVLSTLVVGLVVALAVVLRRQRRAPA